MTVSLVLSRGARRIVKVVAALAALGVLAAASLVALMYFWILPHIGEHRDAVAAMMSRALGQRVTLESVSGTWHQARPELVLTGVRLYDQVGQPALLLPTFRARFSWRTLLVLEPRFSHIALDGLALSVRRARDAHYYVGGIPVNPAAPDSRFANWLLKQGRVNVRDAVVTWQDEMRQAPPLVLRNVDFSLRNRRRQHRLQLAATPPSSVARPVSVEAHWTTRRRDDVSTWRGQIETRVAGLAFPALAAWVSLPYQPHAGSGAVRATFSIAEGKLTGVNAGFNLRGVETRFDDALPALGFDQVMGQFSWQQAGDAHQVRLVHVRVAQRGAPLSSPFDLGVGWQGAQRTLTARAFDLGGWSGLWSSVPMDPALRGHLTALRLQGRVDELDLRWKGAAPGLDNFAIRSHFSGLNVAPVEAHPGIDKLSGRIDGDARRGSFTLDGKAIALSLPRVFRTPVIPIDSLRAVGGWRHTAQGRVVELAESRFANRDAAGSAQGQYTFREGRPGLLDLDMQLTRADGRAVYRYIPRKIGDRTVNWLKDGITAGYSNDVRLRLQGDVTQFPFVNGEGLFRIEAQVKQLNLNYANGWPGIEDIDAQVRFEGKAMEITSEQARIYGVALAPVKAVIPDLLHHEEELHIEGQANGPLTDFIRFANFSPVSETLRGFTDALTATGGGRLTLKLHVPLRHTPDTTVAGRFSLLNATLFPAGLPRLDQVRGDIDFTGNSLSGRNLTAQFLGGPLNVDVATRNGQVQIASRGRVTAAGLAPWLGATWRDRLNGQAAWRGQVSLAPGGALLRVESDLRGLVSGLPAPLDKTAATPLPLLVTSQPQGEGQLHEVQLGKTVGAVWHTTGDQRFTRGEIRFGGPATLPSEPGVRLAGAGRGLAFSEWIALLPEGRESQGLAVSSVDLGFESFDLMGRRYRDIRLQGRVKHGQFHAQVSGNDLNGTLSYRPADAEPARLSAQFRYLSVPEALPGPGGAASKLRGASFPLLDVSVDDFRLQGRPMGKLEATAHGAAQGLVIDTLRLAHADSVLKMNAVWRDGGIGETQADLNLRVHDAGRFLARFGYPDTIKRGIVDVQGNAAWTGSPADFSFESLAGQLDFHARDGQFLKVDPGVAKLLGVLSLQSLPRRLNFDFRDIFNEGYAFDEIAATLRIARGVVYSDDFRMRGPSAKVNMSGLADLNQETVQLRLKVIPKLSEGVALAGALIGGPLAGVGALAAQKLLRDPIEEAISQEYMVVGPWLTPDVKRLSKIKGKHDAQASEP